jgi:hypothetical protein
MVLLNALRQIPKRLGLGLACVALAALSLAPSGAAADTLGGITLPAVDGPIPGTPFNGNAIAFRPLPLNRLGYDEHEYFISGHSNVYDWAPNGNFATTILRSGDYTTRIVVRKPKNPAKWDGTAVVEIANMSGYGPRDGFDYPGVWGNNWREITNAGMAYVGITSKPNIFEQLQRWDPRRYAALSMGNPLAPEAQTCGTLPSDPGYNPSLSKLYENGLIYDAFTQLGALLHSNSTGNPLDSAAQRVYLTGLSQSANYLKTYERFIAPRSSFDDRSPVYNGYREEGGGLRGAPINQCATPLPSADPQNTIPDRGVPVIELHASADFAGDRPRPADSSWFRRWEAAGTFHDNTWTFEYAFVDDANFLLAMPQLGVVVSRDVIPHCADTYPPDPQYQDLYDSSLRALDRWVRLGIPAPHAPYIQDVNGVQVLDQFGNALGGLRLPAVDVPVATYHTELFEPFPDCSHKTRFSDATLHQLYSNHGDYVNKVKQSVRSLVAQGFLTKEDGQDEILQASQSDVP